jgi:hypothetical protein
MILVSAVALAWALLTGCAAPQAATRTGVNDAAGPRALLEKWHKALVTGDKDAYVSCFVGSDDEIVLALAGLEAVQANYAFHDAVVKEFGAEAWKGFSSGGARIDIFPQDLTWTRRITVVRTAATAVGYLPHARVPLMMVEENGVWKLHAGSLVPPGFEAKQAADYQYRWAAAIRGMVEQIRTHQVGTSNVATKADADFRAKLSPAEAASALRAVSDSFLAP